MRIGQLADHVGVNAKTIRYYESIGLLPAPDRTPTGYRIYRECDVDRLAFVRRAQKLRLTLDEIAEILALRESGQRPCSYVLGIAGTRLNQLDQRIAELRHAHTELHALLARAGDLPEDDGCYCRLIDHAPVT